MWLPRCEYDRLVKQVESAQAALELERAENRRVERWYGDMFLRRMQTFPVPAKETIATPPSTDNFTASAAEIDEGELEAFVAAGAEMGVPREEAVRLLKMERGLPV